MSIKRLKFLPLVAAALLALGVPTTGRAAGHDVPPIHTGMTEAQVEKLYGEPDTRTETESGTSWTYTKGLGKAMIPFYGLFSNPNQNYCHHLSPRPRGLLCGSTLIRLSSRR